ncbi:MAG: tRNA 5-methoxyuridine(34)/uridine 5-oxyacetic acid(34) synthase CmoB [Woeseiaceae bacterium]
MLDLGDFETALERLGLRAWQAPIRRLIGQRLQPGAHARLSQWRSLLEALPEIATGLPVLDAPAVRVAAAGACRSESALRACLLALAPWRKGPFDICGVAIDSEWRSDLKWERVRRGIAPLAGRNVLDVGCGNGYYALRMLGDGARRVLGIEPTLSHVVQFLAVQKYLRRASVHVLPLRLEELPAGGAAFDTVFSMGVLYHQRAPLEHLRQLRSVLNPTGELVLETLILPGAAPESRSPPGRYARMRNVWQLPTLPMLEAWLEQSGLADHRLVDVSLTETAEQRRTEWMPFDSLAEALDPADPALTVEGWPRPQRALLVCRAGT